MIKNNLQIEDTCSEFNKILTKEYITELKQHGNGALTALVKQRMHNSGDLVFILENLGYLPATFDANWLINLFDNKNENVRFWAVKNIGKLNSEVFLTRLKMIVDNDDSTMVKREAVSSIGRMRNLLICLLKCLTIMTLK